MYLISSYCNRPIFVFLYVSLHYYEWRYHIIHVCNVSFSFWLWMLSYYWHVKVSVVLYDEAGLFVCVCVWCACPLWFATHVFLYVCMFYFLFYIHLPCFQTTNARGDGYQFCQYHNQQTHVHSRCDRICSLHRHTRMWMHMYAVVQHAVLLTEQIHINLTHFCTPQPVLNISFDQFAQLFGLCLFHL